MEDLRELRQMAGWTQARTAMATAVNRTKLSQAECGELALSAKEEAAVRRVLLAAIRNRAAKIEGVLAGAKAEPVHA